MTLENRLDIKTSPPLVIKIFACSGSTSFVSREGYSLVVKGKVICSDKTLTGASIYILYYSLTSLH